MFIHVLALYFQFARQPDVIVIQQGDEFSARNVDSGVARGGKARRHVKATRAGVEAVREARQALERMWSGLGRMEKA